MSNKQRVMLSLFFVILMAIPISTTYSLIIWNSNTLMLNIQILVLFGLVSKLIGVEPLEERPESFKHLIQMIIMRK